MQTQGAGIGESRLGGTRVKLWRTRTKMVDSDQDSSTLFSFSGVWD